MNTAVIVAAGEGTRFGGERPKQFADILGKPVLIHAIERFELSPVIDEIVVVVSDAELESFSRLAEQHTLTKLRSIVAGGATRTESVLNGLSAIRAEEASIVAIHDGARPCVPLNDIESAVRAARRTGAACLVVPVTDTVKLVGDGLIFDTADRRLLRRALTPQCFKYEVITGAFESLGPDDYVTDDCSVVEIAGGDIEAVEGSPLNIKITYDHDLAVAEMYLKKLKEEE